MGTLLRLRSAFLLFFDDFRVPLGDPRGSILSLFDNLFQKKGEVVAEPYFTRCLGGDSVCFRGLYVLKPS